LVFLSKVIEDNEEYLPDNDEIKNTDETVSVLRNEYSLPFADSGKIHTWAVEYIQHVNELGLLEDYEGELNPLDKLTRKEASNIIEKTFGVSSEFENLDIFKIFSDLTQLNQEEVRAVKSAYTNGIMSGKGATSFCPNDYVTRAEAAAIMTKIIDKLEKLKN